jgi:hypothetical protein
LLEGWKFTRSSSPSRENVSLLTKLTTLRESFVSLSDAEREVLAAAGSTPLQTTRGRAVAIVLAKQGADAQTARALLAESYLAETQPSFHLIPRGDAMAPEDQFAASYRVLADATDGFRSVSVETLASAMRSDPASLAPLRMIVGFTHNELAVAVGLLDPSRSIGGSRLKTFERKPRPATETATRRALIEAIAATVIALMERQILSVPEASANVFHSKLDKRDTRDGWEGVGRDAAEGVPYWALLYQRYVGGVWLTVQAAYSEAKGDALLERPLAVLLERQKVPFHHSRTGASGAAETAQLFGISPGPDFLLPDVSPTVVVETKIGEDGGTVRDKAARIKSLAQAAGQRGLVPCAVIDGKGWRERPAALVEVVIATGGRTFTLNTLDHIVQVPEIAALRGSVEQGD